MRAPMPYRANQSYLDQTDEQDPTLEPDRANANDNGSSTPPAPKAYTPPESVRPNATPAVQRPTDAQLQANGEARPPMPEPPRFAETGTQGGPAGQVAPPPGSVPPQPNGASWNDPKTGLPQNGAMAPAGTPFYQSAQLVPDKNGYTTSTAEGDRANAFRGYVSPDGGGFGSEASAKGWESLTGIPLPQELANADPATLKSAMSLMSRLGNGDPSAIQEALASPVEAIRNAGQSYGMGRGSQGTTPAAYEQFVASRGETARPINANVNSIGGPQGQVAPSPGSATSGNPWNASTGSGGVSPDAAAAPSSATDLLSMLTRGAQGQGAGSQVQDATQQAILESLRNPSSYGTQQVQDAYKWLGGNIDDEYAVEQQKLQEEMARRGLNAGSTIGAGRLSDLNIGKRSAKESMGYELAQKLAETQAGDKRAAISQGLTGGTTAQNSQLDWLRSLMGFGQQGFENDMTTARFNSDQNNQWQNFLMQMLSAGYGG